MKFLNSVVTLLAVRAAWLACAALCCHLPCPRCHLVVLKSRTSTLLSTLSLSFPHLLPGTCTKPGRRVLLRSSASDSHHAPLLLSQAALPIAASHGRTAASHRGLDSSRLAVPCTEPGRPQQLARGCRARPAVAWPRRHQAGCQHASSTGAPQPWPAPRRRTARPPPGDPRPWPSFPASSVQRKKKTG